MREGEDRVHPMCPKHEKPNRQYTLPQKYRTERIRSTTRRPTTTRIRDTGFGDRQRGIPRSNQSRKSVKTTQDSTVNLFKR